MPKATKTHVRTYAALDVWRKLVLAERRVEAIEAELKEAVAALKDTEQFCIYMEVTEDPDSPVNR